MSDVHKILTIITNQLGFAMVKAKVCKVRVPEIDRLKVLPFFFAGLGSFAQFFFGDGNILYLTALSSLSCIYLETQS